MRGYTVVALLVGVPPVAADSESAKSAIRFVAEPGVKLPDALAVPRATEKLPTCKAPKRLVAQSKLATLKNQFSSFGMKTKYVAPRSVAGDRTAGANQKSAGHVFRRATSDNALSSGDVIR